MEAVELPSVLPRFGSDLFLHVFPVMLFPCQHQCEHSSFSHSMFYSVNNQGAGKLYFSTGTKLTVTPGEKHEPSYHKLQGNDSAACLATGFTQINEVNETLFKGTEAVRISDGSVYTQVAVLTTEDKKQKCDELAASSGDCGDPLNRDPMVNLMSLTVVGLRLIFIKTIIFNVLMTFKLWMSQ
nr:uncharacterized protein LOC114921745 isoform X1 [Labrus bergylta]